MSNYSSPQLIPTARSTSTASNNNSIQPGLSYQQRQQQPPQQRPPLAKRAHSHAGHLDSGKASPLTSGGRRPLNLLDDYLPDEDIIVGDGPFSFSDDHQIVNVENNHQQHQRQQRQRHSLHGPTYPGHHYQSQLQHTAASPYFSEESIDSAFLLGSSSPKPRSFLTSTPPHRRSIQGIHNSTRLLKGYQEEQEERAGGDEAHGDEQGQLVTHERRNALEPQQSGGALTTTAAEEAATTLEPLHPPRLPPSPPLSATTPTTDAARQVTRESSQQQQPQYLDAQESNPTVGDRRNSFVTSSTSASGTNVPLPSSDSSALLSACTSTLGSVRDTTAPEACRDIGTPPFSTTLSPTPPSSSRANKSMTHHTHAHPSITIDTSSECLRRPFSSGTNSFTASHVRTEDTLKSRGIAASTTPAAKHSSSSVQQSDFSTAGPTSRSEGQLSSLSLLKQQQQEDEEKQRQQQQQQDHLNAARPLAIPSTSSYTTLQRPPVSGSSMSALSFPYTAAQKTSALPPAPPAVATSSSLHPKAASEGHQQNILLPSLSPTSPRATNPALVNSLDQLSLSWRAPEQTPSFPINRLHRSRTLSSGGYRPNFGSNGNGNGGYFPSFSMGSVSSSSSSQSSTNPYSMVSPTTPMVTSSSYSSLPYSPAVAFLSNLVDKTTPALVNPDDEGEQVGEFIMGKVIGHGGFSVVREAFATQVDGLVARVAVKVVKAQTGSTNNARIHRMLRKEVAIWSRLSHPNVLPFIAAEKLPYATFVFCELCTGGNLLDYLTKKGGSTNKAASASPWGPLSSSSSSSSSAGLPEHEARKIFNQIAAALRYLHVEKQIVHRDIKLENVLQHEDGTWKICDFGLAEYQNEEAANYFDSPLSPMFGSSSSSRSSSSNGSSSSDHHAKERSSSVNGLDAVMEDAAGEEDDVHDQEDDEEESMVGGSLAYCSPEQLRSCTPLKCPSSDVWSLGVVLYALLTGRLPFQDEYEPRLQYQILNGQYEEPTECSAEARDLLRKMFNSKPELRWRIDQVIDSAWCQGTTLDGGDGDYPGGSIGVGNGLSAAGFFSMGTFRF